MYLWKKGGRLSIVSNLALTGGRRGIREDLT